ncbi:MAG: (Fe-S)-binding protein [Desulfovibrio sp.]|jgi:heterodisulfide reductase subunit D|nr:(Fe-S)-binding protein [Desulfovibrio sp.]
MSATQELRGLSAALDAAVDICARCGFCKTGCPTYPFGGGFETFSPRAKVHFLREFAMGREALTPEWSDRFFRCTTCERCETVCQTDIPLIRLWESMRERLVRQGLGPLPAQKRMMENAAAFGNPYGESPSTQTRWMLPEHAPVEGTDILVFGGCTASYRMPAMLQKGVTILTRLGIPFSYAGGEEHCCGSPLLRTGQVEGATGLIGRNLDLFARRKARTIVTPCGGCSKTLKKDYPVHAKSLGKPFDVEVLHVSELYVRLLREGRLVPSGRVERVVTFHDPCHVGRSQGLFEEPRELLGAIPGLRLTEMQRSRTESRCCGAGGGVKAGYPEMAAAIALDRLQEAVDTGADTLVTMCPFCQGSFSQAIRESGAKIALAGLEDLLFESLWPARAA